MAISSEVTCFAVADIQIQEVSDQVKQLLRRSFKFPGSSISFAMDGASPSEDNSV